jgi:hypothetical protein
MGGLLVTFFVWAPWLACRPLTDLASQRVVVDQVPTDARCYTVEHGRIHFDSHGTVADDPYRFMATTAILVLLWGLFLWSFRWNSPQQRFGFRDLFRAIQAQQYRLALMTAIVFLIIIVFGHLNSR